jgi:hypothetical protein
MVPDGEGKLHVVDIHSKYNVEPSFNPETDTRFMLFTRSNPTNGQQITWTTQSIQNSNFNSAHPVRFLIHGWNSGLSSGMNTAPTASYLQLGNFNVIQVLLFFISQKKILSNIKLFEKYLNRLIGVLAQIQLTTLLLETAFQMLHFSWLDS